MRSLHGVLILIFTLVGCAYIKGQIEILREAQAPSTFAKFLESAQAGDAKSQNLVGFMFYFGEVAPKDRNAAHYWFHLAADQGHPGAQQNLAVMHYLGAGVSKDSKEAEWYFHLAKRNNSHPKDSFSRIDLPASLAELAERAATRPQGHAANGELTYVTFCAGCHGLNGIAAYVGAPSFALAERMEKSEAELLRSILHGHGVMPNWGNKLSSEELGDALRFIRTLPQQYQKGIAQVLRPAPRLFFLFGPMSFDGRAYRPQNSGY